MKALTPAATHMGLIGLLCLGMGFWAGCGHSSAPQPARSSTSQYAQPPEVVPNAYAARITGGGGNLWLLVGGRQNRRRSELSLRVLAMQPDGRWRKIVSPPGKTDEAAPLGFATLGSKPCVSASQRPHRVTVRCLEHGRWRPVYSRRASGANFYIQQLASVGGRLVALTSARAPRGARRYGLLELGRRTRRAAKPMTFRGLAALGAPDAGRPTLGVQGIEHGNVVRRTLRLSGRRWRAAAKPLLGFRTGPQTSGPVLGEHPLQAVTVGSGDAWPFSVVVLREGNWQEVGGGPLNRTQGRAQGAIFSPDTTPWAIWQEHTLRPDGAFDAEVFAAPVDANAAKLDSVTTLWQGRSIGPGELGIASTGSEIWALVTRPSPDAPETLQPLVVRLGG